VKTLFLARASVVVGIQDLMVFYTWRTWLLGWLTRVILQVTFFAMLGRYMGGDDHAWFLLVGGSAGVAALEALTVVLHTAEDRLDGILPLLVAAPGNYYLVLLFRNVNCIATGVATSSVALLLCPLLVDVPAPPFPRVLAAVPLLALGAVTTYLLGGFLSALVSNILHGRWIVFNVSYMAITALCGLMVPRDFWPAPLSSLAAVLPFTHALEALRGALGGAAVSTVLTQCGLELLVAAGWFVAGWLAFAASIAKARRDGTIELVA
jgi:ABC-2 type transport system permease protein